MKTSDFDYVLPPEYIAQTPIEPRDASRLLVLKRADGSMRHVHFYQIGEFLNPGDVLVVNQTRVIPARLFGRKIPTGGKVEILLLNKKDAVTWETLVGGKGMSTGKRVQVDDGPNAEIVAVLSGARRTVRFSEPIEDYLAQIGHVPLPPYIHVSLDDPERYQTVFALHPGSAAAPTAGLHFTERLTTELTSMGIGFVHVTLHVGLDTFAPVDEKSPEEHIIHTEWCQVTSEAAETINQAREGGGRIIAVGTTSVRTLESAVLHATPGKLLGAFDGPTDLYILPGYEFQAVDALITNFHLPRSTLIMLVSAFAGRKRIMEAYQAAMDLNYRFYSFGDAMLIL
jgi:S-adenosylmethionine:tRNA ribosyltransferase-isomerase